MTQQKGIEVCGVMVFFMLTQSHICNISMGMVIWYDKCVWYHTNCSCSITCRNGPPEKMLYILDSFANHSYGEHRSIAFRSLAH